MERAVLTTWKTIEGRFADPIQMILKYRGIEYLCDFMDEERVEDCKSEGEWNTYPKLVFEYKGGEERSFYGLNSILRYVGQTYGFYFNPLKWSERQEVDGWIDHCNIILNGLVFSNNILLNSNFLDEKLEKMDTLVKETEYLVENELSIADFKLFSLIALFSSGDIMGYNKQSFSKYNKLFAWCNMFATNYEEVILTAKENKKDKEDNYPFVVHKGRYYINKKDCTKELMEMNNTYEENIKV
jgi:hypothetical protein